MQYLFAHAVEPALKDKGVVFVLEYPLCDSPQATEHLDDEGCRVAERFELYVHGVELANGNCELKDADVLEQRLGAMAQDGAGAPLDQALIAAMRSGKFPDCSGVALGMDRLAALASEMSALP
jgi:lysyl-tRNA synthetase class 2